MLTRAVARYVRVAPRKTRKVIDLIRGLPAVKAEAILDTIEKRPAVHVKRLLRSALDSADKRFHVSSSDLYISLIKADQGPMLKRYRAASMGRAAMVAHRTSHITLELDRIIRPGKKDTAQAQTKHTKDINVRTGQAASPARKSEPSAPKADRKQAAKAAAKQDKIVKKPKKTKE